MERSGPIVSQPEKKSNDITKKCALQRESKYWNTVGSELQISPLLKLLKALFLWLKVFSSYPKES